MRECWINVYLPYRFETKYWYGSSWRTIAEAKESCNLAGRKLLYRIHVRIK